MDKILLINHSSDTRYDTNKICSHNKIKINSQSLEKLQQLNMVPPNNAYMDKTYLLIDEAQFFTDLYDTILNIMIARRSNKQNITIWIFGLDGDFQMRPFSKSRMLELIPLASEIVKIPYRNPLTGKHTVYVPDFFIEYVDKNGVRHMELIEIKPANQQLLEKVGKNKVNQALYIKNQAKWQAAQIWAKQNGIKFRVLNEDDLFMNGKAR